jgi:hypothetical protein
VEGDHQRTRPITAIAAVLLVVAVCLGYGPWHDWLLDNTATAMASVALVLFALEALDLRRRALGVGLVLVACALAAATVAVARQPATTHLLEETRHGDDYLRLTLVEERSLLRTDRTVEVYGINDEIERTWMLWRRAGGDAPRARFLPGTTDVVIQSENREYRTSLSEWVFIPSRQYCIRTVRCGEVTG